MNEAKLRDFFRGKINGKELNQDLVGSVTFPSEITSIVHVKDMDGEFTIKRSMLISLCDAVLIGDLDVQHLGAISFALLASDHFEINADEDETMVEVINDWSCPEINFTLSIPNVKIWRDALTNDLKYPFDGLELYPKSNKKLAKSDGIISLKSKDNSVSG